MTRSTQQRLTAMAEYLGLHVAYVNDLPDHVTGALDPEARNILVNARKPPCDQALTLGHEMAHYIMHCGRPPRNFVPWYVNCSWKAKNYVKWSRLMRKFIRKNFNQEWEAELWAFILLWCIGARDDLFALIKLYPEKTTLFYVSLGAVLYSTLRQGPGNILRSLLDQSGKQ